MMDDKLNSTATTMSLFCRSMEFNQRYLGMRGHHRMRYSTAGRQADRRRRGFYAQEWSSRVNNTPQQVAGVAGERVAGAGHS